MKHIKYIVLLILSGNMLIGCFDDMDDVPFTATTEEINDFIWKGMHTFYVYKDDVPDLSDDRFTSNEEYNNFLTSFSSPGDFFTGLRTPETVIVDTEEIKVDSFSFLVDDYVTLEQAFNGISQSNGMEYGLKKYPAPNESRIFGYVRYVLPETEAATKGIIRGTIFNTVNGIQMDNENFSNLLAADSYTIGLATYDGTNVTPTGVSVSLTKSQYTENPVFIAKTLDIEGESIGYLMYNSFTSDFDQQLNDVFGQFASDGVTNLVLDLRYNGGGSVITAIDLSSMITGQFNGQVFTTEAWNSDRQEQFGKTNFFDKKIRTGTDINSLQLTRVYILTTDSSASASELVINGLDPYIDVIQVGATSKGKFQASITLYDSPNFGRQNINIGHTYAIQPLVIRTLNSVGFTDYYGGFTPEVLIEEDYANLGVLGDVNEPLLGAAIDHIMGNKSANTYHKKVIESVGESKMYAPNFQRMYLD